MEDLVKVFNAQSSTTEVEMRYLEDSEYEDRLNKLLEEGGQADVIWLRQPSKSNRMAEAGQLFVLSQLGGRQHTGHFQIRASPWISIS